MNHFIIFGDIFTFVGGIGTAIFLILCIVVAATQINLPGGEKKFVEMLIASKTLGVFLSFVLGRMVMIGSEVALYFLLSLVFAVIAVILIVIFSTAKGIGVGVNGKK